MQLDFSYRQFTFIFWKLHLSNAIFTFYIEAWCIFDFAYTFDLLCCAYILHLFILDFGTLSGYLWYTFGLLLVQSLASIHVCVASCIVLLCATITTRQFHSLFMKLFTFWIFYMLVLITAMCQYMVVVVVTASLYSFVLLSILHHIFGTHLFHESIQVPPIISILFISLNIFEFYSIFLKLFYHTLLSFFDTIISFCTLSFRRRRVLRTSLF